MQTTANFEIQREIVTSRGDLKRSFIDACTTFRVKTRTATGALQLLIRVD